MRVGSTSPLLRSPRVLPNWYVPLCQPPAEKPTPSLRRIDYRTTLLRLLDGSSAPDSITARRQVIRLRATQLVVSRTIKLFKINCLKSWIRVLTFCVVFTDLRVMCRKREYDDRDRLVCPWPMVELIDLTVDEFAEDEFDGFIDVNILPMNENWNYPYNLLPSNDEEEPVNSIIYAYSVFS